MPYGPKTDFFSQSYIEKRSEPCPMIGCWLWLGNLDAYGYGVFRRFPKDVWHKAYRVSYQVFNGEIPVNFSVLHRCNMKSCVNPAHLYAGTQKNNMRDVSNFYLSKIPLDKALSEVKLSDKSGRSFSSVAKKYGIGRKTLRREALCRTR